MTLEEFRHTLPDHAPPPGLGLALRALWWAGRNDWAAAHASVQQQEGEPDCDLVHAHLHRMEGDLANAAYWYRRAGRPVATAPIDEEWAMMVGQMLEKAL